MSKTTFEPPKAPERQVGLFQSTSPQDIKSNMLWALDGMGFDKIEYTTKRAFLGAESIHITISGGRSKALTASEKAMIKKAHMGNYSYVLIERKGLIPFLTGWKCKVTVLS